jgi:flotillin
MYAVIIAIVVVAIIMLAFVMLLMRFYKRCPSDRILVVYGKGTDESGVRCIHGGAVFVMPLLQDYAFLSLEPIRIEVSLPPEASGGSEGLRLPHVFTVAIGTTPELMQAAAIRLVGLGQDEIKQLAEDVILGELGEAAAAAGAAGGRPDTATFHAALVANLHSELAKLGLVLVNLR